MHNFRYIIVLLLFIIGFTSCEDEYVPKPRGYFRIDLPEPAYKSFAPEECDFKFDLNKLAYILPDKEGLQEPCWYNVYYPKFKATIHLSYKKIDNNLVEMTEDARSLVYKHTVKASDIQEYPIVDDSLNVYGLVYELEGDAASLMQFYLTDSVSHFVRGALYFNVAPNHDSLAPVTAFIKHDIKQMVNSFEWK